MRVGILMCDHVDEDRVHIAGDYDAMVAALLATAPDIELVVHDAVGGDLPDAPDACDAWIVTGSRAGVNDDLAWLDALRDFLSRVVAERVPVVGICFGHQLLAQVLGARVTRSQRGWGVGTHETTIVASADWMGQAPASYRILNMHQDQVEALPAGARLLATSPHCPVAMFGHGDSVLAIQGHPEFVPDYERALIEARRERIGVVRADEALDSLGTAPDRELLAGWIAGFLGAAVASRRRSDPAGPGADART